MYWILSILLFANWAFGLASGAKLGAWVHLLLLGGLVALALAAVDGARRPRPPRPRHSAARPSAARQERSA